MAHQTGGQMNGSNIMGGPLMPVGHQQDLNYVYRQVQELAELLKANREKTAQIIAQANEVVRRANNGTLTTGGTVDDPSGENLGESDAAKIHQLTIELSRKNRIIAVLKDEQTQNTRLIADYEDAMGTAVDQIRTYCSGIEEKFLTQRRAYNNILQQEKDEHLNSRLDRDAWHAEAMKLAGQIRQAFRLRVDEEGQELAVVTGLQAQVRAYRVALGMPKESPEDETGWCYLRDTPLNLEGIDET